jgi:hypothetical protein
LFICPKDTARCGEASSPHDVNEVVIVGEKTPLHLLDFQKLPTILSHFDDFFGVFYGTRAVFQSLFYQLTPTFA